MCKFYLYLILSIGLLYSPANAEIFWQAYITKNNNRSTTEIVTLSSDTVRLNLPGMPVKAVVEPTIEVTTPEGSYVARLLSLEFLDGTGAATGTVCASDWVGRGNTNTLMVRRQYTMYQIDLQCLGIPDEPKP